VKFHSSYLLRLAAVVTVSVMLAGCTHIYMKSSEMSVLHSGSPLKGVNPKIFAFKDFRDVRGKDPDPYLVTVMRTHKYRLDQPKTTFVAIAIRKELERNGHTCIAYSAQSKSDFIIEGSLYTFGVYQDRRGWLGGEATVAVKLTVTPVPPKEELLTKTYEGEGKADGGKNALDQALLAMVKEISTDPEPIAFLEKWPAQFLRLIYWTLILICDCARNVN